VVRHSGMSVAAGGQVPSCTHGSGYAPGYSLPLTCSTWRATSLRRVTSACTTPQLLSPSEGAALVLLLLLLLLVVLVLGVAMAGVASSLSEPLLPVAAAAAAAAAATYFPMSLLLLPPPPAAAAAAAGTSFPTVSLPPAAAATAAVTSFPAVSLLPVAAAAAAAAAAPCRTSSRAHSPRPWSATSRPSAAHSAWSNTLAAFELPSVLTTNSSCDSSWAVSAAAKASGVVLPPAT
jgi:hypothetical protein